MANQQIRIILVHGYQGSPSSAWLPWLKTKLEVAGYDVYTPEMPDSFHPVANQWVAKLSEVIGVVDENTYLVGHSLGCVAILRYVESLPVGQKVGGALLVAGFAQSLNIKEHVGFFDTSWDEPKIRESCKKFIALASDDDPYVPRELADDLRDNFGAELKLVPGAGHFNREAGYVEAPVIYDAVMRMVNKENEPNG